MAINDKKEFQVRKELLVVFMFAVIFAGAQNKWDKDLVVRYKMTDKNGHLQNYVEVKSDTLSYEWIEKEKPVKRKFLMDAALAAKITKAMESNKVLKFNSANYAKGASNIVFTYEKGGKLNEIVFPQNIKANSKEEKFIREFMEPILVKVFAQELNNLPR